jgi:putative ABC transport system substrate-binding protein
LAALAPVGREIASRRSAPEVLKAIRRQLGVAHGVLVAARAQRANPVVGFVHYGSPDELAHLATAIREGLKEMGYVEGQNMAIEYRWAKGRYDHLPAMVADLVGRQVAVITACGNAATISQSSGATTI